MAIPHVGLELRSQRSRVACSVDWGTSYVPHQLISFWACMADGVVKTFLPLKPIFSLTGQKIVNPLQLSNVSYACIRLVWILFSLHLFSYNL